jgi:protein ImuB
MAFAVVFVPDFPVQAVLRVEPDGRVRVRHHAVVILDGPESMLRAVAVNEMARSFGIEVGMTKLKIETSSRVVLKRRSSSLESTAQQALIDCASAFSPRVESTAAGIVTADLAGCARLFGSVEQLATQLAVHLSKLHFEANVAVAENPDAALFAARGFSGVTIIPKGEEANRLGVLPLRILTDSRVMLATFDAWGIESFKQLALMPIPALKKRLGSQGEQLQKLALGQVNRLLVPVEARITFEEVYDLEHESQVSQESAFLEQSPDLPNWVELECNQDPSSPSKLAKKNPALRPAVLPGQFDPILFILNRLLDLLLARLRSRSLATDELHVRFELEAHEKDEHRCKSPVGEPCSYHRILKLPVPTQDTKALFKLIQLAVSAHPPCAPIRKIFVSAEPARQRTVQLGFFSANALEPEKLEILLARIRDVIGSEDNQAISRLGIPSTVDSHFPGDFTVQPFSSEALGDTESLAVAAHPIAAIRMFRPPLPARVSLDGQGCPAAIQFKGSRGKVVAAGGPDVLSGAWWESEKRWKRSCWVVAVRFTSGMGIFTLYEDTESNDWFVNGVVD